MKIKCLKCNDIVESKHIHDLRRCKCGAIFIDGGDKYTRIGGDLKYIHYIYDDGHEEEIITKMINYKTWKHRYILIIIKSNAHQSHCFWYLYK